MTPIDLGGLLITHIASTMEAASFPFRTSCITLMIFFKPIDETIKTICDGLSPKANYFPPGLCIGSESLLLLFCFVDLLPGTTGYTAITSSYFWSSSKQNPLGVFQPATPEDVALVVRILDIVIANRG